MKNVLYRNFSKVRTKENENEFKIYNKLTSIMRLSKKDYYHKLLEQNKSNSQGIWKVLKKHNRKLSWESRDAKQFY